MKKKINDSSDSAWTVKSILCVFLEYSNANKSFLVFSVYGCCSALGFHQLLYQVVSIRSLFLV